MTIVCEPDPSIAIAVASCTDDGSIARMVAELTEVADLLLEEDTAECVVVLGPGVDLVEAMAFVGRIAQDDPAVGVILVRDNLNATVRDLALDRGVREVLATRDLATLAAACRRATYRHPAETSTRPRPAGRIITVFGATSGQGRTTLAANLAVVLNAGGKNRVCLVDLDLAFGDLTDFLAERPEPAPDHPAVAWSPLATPYLPGLDLVLAPERPGDAVAVPADRTEDVLTGLATGYDYVIVDTPQQCSAQVLSALDVAHHHVLVAAAERPALRHLRRTLDMLDLLEYPLESRSIVLNRCDPRVTPTRTEIDLVLRNPIAAGLPLTVDIPVSINQGMPLALSRPTHPFAQALRRFAGALASTVSADGARGGDSA
jgi:MinD-like ATPase involved in chromosome partitioning or flagellar assembly